MERDKNYFKEKIYSQLSDSQFEVISPRWFPSLSTHQQLLL